MGSFTRYYVPDNPLSPGPRVQEIGAQLWGLGLPFLPSAAQGDLPERTEEFDIVFEAMGFELPPLEHPIPHFIEDLRCPDCDSPVAEVANEVWNYETEQSLIPASQRLIACPACGAKHVGSSLISETDFTFSTCYLWVDDIDPDEWPDQVRLDIESALGECKEYTSWST